MSNKFCFGVLGALAFAAASVVMPSAAQATVVQCYGAVAGFQLDTNPASTCVGSGGSAGDINTPGSVPFAGYVMLDKSDDGTTGVAGWLNAITLTGAGTPSGTFTINPGSGYDLSSLILAFRDGNGHEDGYGAFLLSALSGSWAIINPSQNLSHMSLYGVPCPVGGCPSNAPDPGQTPIPGAAFLMGSVIAGGAGFGAWRRRRKEKLAA